MQAKLLAAFQQHPWLWERLLRVDMHELLGSQHATAVVVEVSKRVTAGPLEWHRQQHIITMLGPTRIPALEPVPPFLTIFQLQTPV